MAPRRCVAGASAGRVRITPTQVELMYQPTVQSNTAGARVRFLDKK
jgi:hypothetical protein